MWSKPKPARCQSAQCTPGAVARRPCTLLIGTGERAAVVLLLCMPRRRTSARPALWCLQLATAGALPRAAERNAAARA